MNLQEIINQLDLAVLTHAKAFSSIYPTGGYASDLLSCVMAGAKHQALWITLQCHVNIVAVAALLELAAVIITEGAIPIGYHCQSQRTGSHLALYAPATFAISGKLWEMGVRER